MRRIELENDEVILLEDEDVEYSGPFEKSVVIKKLVLTNKRLVATWTKKREKKGFEIKLSEIKKFNGEAQVDYYDSDQIGDSLRVQALSGVHYFSVNTDDTFASVGSTFKSLFSSKTDSAEKKAQLVWVNKIKEVINEKPENVAESKVISKPAVTSAVENKEVKEMNICPECGKEFDKSSNFCPSCGTPVNKPKVVEVEKVVEIVRCRKCGAKMSPDTKFCPSCGTPVVEEPKANAPFTPVPPVVEKKETRQNKVQKCPICGEIIPSDALSCPSCGHEVRGREAVSSVQAFFDKISSIDDEDKKIEAIKMYVIPNNKEDIMEFMFLAVSNFDAKLYATNKQGENIAGAWYTKIEQCYKKAKLMFTDPNDIAKVEKMYQETQTETKNIKKTKLIMTVSGIAVIILSLLLMMLGTPTDTEGHAQAMTLFYISMAILAAGIILLVLGLKKKKTNKQLEEERIAKMNKKNKK